MARPEKVAAVDDVRQRLEASTATVLTEYRGLTVGELAALRAELRKSEADYVVVKNTLTRIAVREAGLEVPDELLTGPTAVTYCVGDPVAAAKVLRAFSRDHPALTVKGGILEGRLLDAGETLRLADLASREELLGQLAGMMDAVLAQPARLAQASLSKVARLFAALQEKTPADDQVAAPGEEAEVTPPTAEAAEAAAAETTAEPAGPVTSEEATSDAPSEPPGDAADAEPSTAP